MDKVICVGKNYLKHAIELGDAVPEEPLYFLKPPSVILTVDGASETLALPATGSIHHELELVFEIRRVGNGFRLSRYTIGLDLTLRELQDKLKKAGQPWEKAKVFKNSCVLGPWREVTNLEKLCAAQFSLELNGKVRQQGQGQDMRWGPDFLLKDIPQWFPLCDGDVLFTGTPEGVGPLENGDVCRITGPDIKYQITIQRK